MSPFPEPDFRHLLHLTTERGTFEHADGTEPRPEHAYCTDDMARVLVVTSREPDLASDVRRLASLSLRFLDDAQSLDGGFRNRRNRSGGWDDQPTVEDCWGRSLWGLGTAAARSDVDIVRQTAVALFERGASTRSPWLRANAFAALGAAEVLTSDPGHRAARRLLTDIADVLAPADPPPGRPSGGPASGRPSAGPADWPWPEPRLSYANAVIPEAMIAAGSALERPELLGHGLGLLTWLVEHETLDGRLSVTPVGGAGPGDEKPAFDQQPVEVATLADACVRAGAVDHDRRWSEGVAAAVRWFVGDNDAGRPMWDPSTGGGFDGLERDGVNRNQGAESSLALLSTLQHARQLEPVPG
jgi:hypothetical protein